MAYIGSTPTSQNFIAGTDYFNGTGSQTAFTLTRSVNSVNDIEVTINNVVQQPDSYTVSGTTLTISAAPSSGTSNVYVRYLSTTLQSITVPANSIDSSKLAPLSSLPITGGYTATLPAATGTVMVSGNQPAFSATKVNATQSITSNTWTKVTFDTEEFDTANCFTSSTFTPTVAGYYQVNGQVDIYPSVAGSRSAIRIYKNGSNYKSGNDIQISTQVEMGVVVSAVCYCNGTTDYLELYALMTATSPAIQNYSTRFDAVLVRSA